MARTVQDGDEVLGPFRQNVATRHVLKFQFWCTVNRFRVVYIHICITEFVKAASILFDL